MPRLETATNRFTEPDLAYRLLIESHRGLSDEESAALNARLILILINQIGELEVLKAALRLAKDAGSREQAAGDMDREHRFNAP